MYPTIYVLIPKDETGQEWIDENINPDHQSFGGGVAIGHRYMQDIWDAICDEEIQTHFEVRC